MKRLLVAYDFNPGSANALLRAIRLAAGHGAAVRALHAADGHVLPPGTDSEHRSLLAEARIMAEELERPDLDISACVRPGNAAEAILADAEAFDADLIVMGAHGTPRFRDALFGTTASHVVRHSDRAVLVVQDRGGTDYSKVMIAIDDPLAAQSLLTTAFAVAPGAEAFAVHAFYPTLGQTLSGLAEIERHEDGLERQIRDVVSAAAARETRQNASVSVHAVVETGDVMTVLMKAYEALQPGLLAIGTRARATYLGSHAVDTLFWCPHDVLVVPDGAKVMSPDKPPAPAAALKA